VAPLAKGSAPSAGERGGTRRVVLRGASECANSLASDFNESDLLTERVMVGIGLPAGTPARYI